MLQVTGGDGVYLPELDVFILILRSGNAPLEG
jgi:hypothetical protein